MIALCTVLRAPDNALDFLCYRRNPTTIPLDLFTSHLQSYLLRGAPIIMLLPIAYWWPILIWAVLFWWNCNLYHLSIEGAPLFHTTLFGVTLLQCVTRIEQVCCDTLFAFHSTRSKRSAHQRLRPAGVDSVGLMNWARRECVTSSDFIFRAPRPQIPTTKVRVSVRQISFIPCMSDH